MVSILLGEVGEKIQGETVKTQSYVHCDIVSRLYRITL